MPEFQTVRVFHRYRVCSFVFINGDDKDCVSRLNLHELDQNCTLSCQGHTCFLK